MVLGVVALIIALAALVIALCRDPMQSGLALRNPFNPLGGYDVETAAGAAKSQLEMRMKNDVRAFAEMERRMKDKQLEEKVSTFRVESEADFKRDKKDDADKKSPWTGECKILFVTYKDDGKDKKEVYSMEKHNSGMWDRRGPSSFEVGTTNKELQKKMDDWVIVAEKK